MLTIDDQHTRDMDDAIEVLETSTGWTVRVAIADVSRLVTPGSDLDREARERGFTRYFGTGNSPMLPRDLADGKFSLWPKKERRTIVVTLKLSPELELVSTKLTLEVLTSEEKLSYTQIPELLEGTDVDPSLQAQVRAAKKLAQGLLRKRRAAGALVYYDIHNGWVTTEEGFLKKLKDHTETIGYVIIQELMVLTNTAVALYAVKHKVPLLFRNHEQKKQIEGRDEVLQALAEAQSKPIVDFEAFRRQANMFFERAAYGSRLIGHFGLSVKAYTHFTSPIRRYADLVVHQQLRAHLKGLPLPHTEESIELTAAYLNELIEKDRESDSSHFRKRDEKQAMQHIEARKIEGLIPKQFERVVKVETRSGKEPSEAFVEAWHYRLKNKTVQPLCMTTVFMHGVEAAGSGLKRVSVPGWDVVKAATIGYLTENTPDAVTIFTQAASLGWPTVNLEAEQLGASHVASFTGRASVLLDGELVKVEVPAKSSKEARQRAAVALLATMAQVPVPEFKGPPAPVVVKPEPKKLVVEPGKNPVSLLMEHSQAVRCDPPRFEYSQTGAAHAPVITCRARFLGHEVEAVSTSKSEAKTLVAKALIERLR